MCHCDDSVMKQYQTRIKELEHALSSLTEKHKKLEFRRSLDVEGFNNDVTALRKQVGPSFLNKTCTQVLPRTYNHMGSTDVATTEGIAFSKAPLPRLHIIQ